MTESAPPEEDKDTGQPASDETRQEQAAGHQEKSKNNNDTEDSSKTDKKGEKDEKKDPGQAARTAKSAQDNATDPQSAWKWYDRGKKIDNAMQSLVGAPSSERGSVFVFLDAKIDQIGDRMPPMSSQIGMVVRSGRVAESVLDRIRQSYVEPAGYARIRQMLESHQFVLIRARAGTGRTTTALRLLDQLCRQGVNKLDPDIRLKVLEGKDFQESQGYLIESLGPDQARGLRAFHADRLSQTMREKGCMLVAIVDESAQLVLKDVADFVVDDLGPIEARDMLRRHVEWGLRGSDGASSIEVLERPEIKEIISGLPPDLSCRDLSELGTLLAGAVTDQISLDVVRERYSRTSEAGFIEWFDQQQDIEQRAFVIALAVFNNETVQIVSTAATALADLIKGQEIANPTNRSRTLFTIPLSKRLEDARAELINATAETEYGSISVIQARFRDEHYPRQILEHVCSQYNQAFALVCEWLRDLGDNEGPASETVRVRAGVAAGLLSLYDFTGMCNSVILHWADLGRWNPAWTAVAALQVPGQHPALSRIVYTMLDAWITKGQNKVPEARRITAIRALGTTTAMSPQAVLRLLRFAAKQDDEEMATAIAESVCELFYRVDDPGQVLAALERWSRGNVSPARRNTALLAVLTLSFYVNKDMPDSTEKWPVFVWLAESDEAKRSQIVVLFGRLLQAAGFMVKGYGELRRWVTIAEKDTTLREPIARLLTGVIQETNDSSEIRFYFNNWAQTRQPEAAHTILALLDQEGL